MVKHPLKKQELNTKVKNWKDLASLPVSKQSEIKSHTEPKSIITIEKVNMDKAFKRRRPPLVRKPKEPTAPKLGRVHYTKGGTGLTRRMDR
jgi:hypothetical protein